MNKKNVITKPSGKKKIKTINVDIKRFLKFGFPKMSENFSLININEIFLRYSNDNIPNPQHPMIINEKLLTVISSDNTLIFKKTNNINGIGFLISD